MIIKFSRHARRRSRLYKIPEDIVREILSDADFSDGEHEVVKNVPGFGYPIKILVAVEDGTITVITNYPLKKGKANENSL